MILNEWAKRWGIPTQAIDELRQSMGEFPPHPTFSGEEGSEAANQSQIRMAASKKGVKLFRNNVGAGTLDNGSFVRWGICNDSAALNAKMKSSDLIGIKPVLITPEMVGHRVGQFIAREVKRPGWKYSGSKREEAQMKFIQYIVAMGGNARFTCSPEGDL